MSTTYIVKLNYLDYDDYPIGQGQTVLVTTDKELVDKIVELGWMGHFNQGRHRRNVRVKEVTSDLQIVESFEKELPDDLKERVSGHDLVNYLP